MPFTCDSIIRSLREFVYGRRGIDCAGFPAAGAGSYVKFLQKAVSQVRIRIRSPRSDEIFVVSARVLR
jgi:hypothetical protein